MTVSVEQIRSVPWHRYGQPEFNHPTAVADALVEMLHAENELQICEEAGDKLLHAVANEHRGTYYPVLIYVLPFIEEMLRTGNKWQKRVLLSILDDFMAGYECEGVYETLYEPIGDFDSVEEVFKRVMYTMRPVLEQIVISDEFNSELARELIYNIEVVVEK
jgi:hypothetical protein